MHGPAILLLISSLGSEDFRARERAQADLQALARLSGYRLVEDAARGHRDPEVRRRCRAVAERGRYAELAGPAKGLFATHFEPPRLDQQRRVQACSIVGEDYGRFGEVYVGLLVKGGYGDDEIRKEVGRARARKRERDKDPRTRTP